MSTYPPGLRQGSRSCFERGDAIRFRVLQLTICTLLSTVLYGCAPPLVTRGLRAEYPAQRLYFPDPPPASFVKVDSLQPTLRWESFPREQDFSSSSKEELSRITAVTYQLRIANKGWSYVRDNLTEPCHKIEDALQPSTKYLWTVRACFKLDGEPRCTEWGALSDWDRKAVSHPNVWSYRFQTPTQ